MDHKPRTIAKHPRSDTLIGESGILKIAEYRLVGGQIHGPVVGRLLPAMKLWRVTLRTRPATHIAGPRIDRDGDEIVAQKSDCNYHEKQAADKAHRKPDFFHTSRSAAIFLCNLVLRQDCYTLF